MPYGNLSQFAHAHPALAPARKKRGAMRRRWQDRRSDPADADRVHPVQATVIDRSMATAAELLGARRFEQATQLIGQVLRHAPEYPDAHNLMGVAARGRGDMESAIGHFRRAAELNPQLAGAQANLGLALVDQGRHGEARTPLMRALEIDPSNALALYGVGVVLSNSCAFAEAEAVLRRAVRISPRYAEAHAKLGFVQFELEHFREADRSCRRAIALQPENPAIHDTLGRVLTAQGRFEEALESLGTAASLDPGTADTRFHLAEPLLSLGQLTDGWDAYEHRQKPEGEGRWPVWRGESLAGRSILIRPEGDLRDQILFASCFSDVLRQADRCVICCAHELGRLFQQSFPRAEICGVAHDDEVPDLPGIDFQILSGSLMRQLRRNVEDFPSHAGYLRVDAARRSALANCVAALGPGLKVGISWRGKTGTEVRRAFMPLTDWGAVLATTDVHFVNLQYDDASGELAESAGLTGTPVHEIEGLDVSRDLDGLAALLSVLDLVIAPNNEILTLAGAVGAPLWFLDTAPGFGTFGTGRCLWFPRARVYRREVGTPDWSAVLRRVAADLAVEAHQQAAA